MVALNKGVLMKTVSVQCFCESVQGGQSRRHATIATSQQGAGNASVQKTVPISDFD